VVTQSVTAASAFMHAENENPPPSRGEPIVRPPEGLAYLTSASFGDYARSPPWSPKRAAESRGLVGSPDLRRLHSPPTRAAAEGREVGGMAASPTHSYDLHARQRQLQGEAKATSSARKGHTSDTLASRSLDPDHHDASWSTQVGIGSVL
jgi:hypothetical protein